MEDRRTFIKKLSALGLLGLAPETLLKDALHAGNISKPFSASSKTDKIWACLMHLSFNFAGGIKRWGGIRTVFEPEQATWDKALETMAANGINMAIINLDDSVLWRTHPEISLKNSWTPEKIRSELSKMRALGIEPIPMLNFSTTHDAWLGKYSYMVSTKKYYSVCSDLINEAVDIFNNPRFIHFGMDEESADMQQQFDHIVVRLNEQWWGDLYFYVSEALSRNVRPMVWSDYYWHHPDMFLKMMPKSVVQCNWYYGEDFDVNNNAVKAYLDLSKEGFDLMACSSDDGIIYGKANDNSASNTVKFCHENIDNEHLLGFMQTFWMPTTSKYEDQIVKAINLLGSAREYYNLIDK